ncbi:mannosyl-oligosaccharide 1,2-alpha-mannosidase MNS1 [Neoconidiobolus thromboides FSU 785]|nr:mannosyl-oligosaccharide 1,2-alpha-mannosidase MNS1 [Neoconidiobolus thromboides FSU 785]
MHAWSGYKRYAFGNDELRPLTNATVNDRFQGWGLTMVDSMTTLYLMGYHDEFDQCVERIGKVNFSKSNGQVLFFETVIRYLGGLVSSYDLSGHKVLLEKAVQLADALLPAFNSPSGLPFYRIDFSSKQPDYNKNRVILAEIGSVQLEFTRLSVITGDPKYKNAALKVYDLLDLLKKPSTGLYPLYLNVVTGQFDSKEISFGALGDSYYEYLLKLHILLGNTQSDNKYLTMFQQSIVGLKSLLRRGNMDYLYLGRIDNNGNFQQDMDHLTFFLPGLLSLASRVTGSSDYQALGLELLESCYHAYQITTTGLGPEVVSFSSSRDLSVRVPNNSLRPELIESLFYAYKMTGDKKYQDWAWSIFQSFLTYSKSETGFTVYQDVMDVDKSKNQLDIMESFFLAETMKYFYLIFEEREVVDLDQWVFNTEAHPLKISK